MGGAQSGVEGGAWRFMGVISGVRSPHMGYNYSFLLITLLITTHESPSGEGRRIGIRVQRFALEGSGD